MQPQSAEIKLHGASRTKPGLHANTKPDPKEAPGLQHRAWRVLVIELRVEPVSKRSTPHKTTLTRAALPSRLELRYNSRYVIETSTGSRAPRQLEHSIRSTVPLPRSQCRSLRDEEWTTIAKSTHATIGSSPSALRTGEATKVDVQGGPTLDRINTRCPQWVRVWPQRLPTADCHDDDDSGVSTCHTNMLTWHSTRKYLSYIQSDALNA
uniref:Uncharacterized protein n=1 Tax=Physcomitrium patens TaxID=3218 RepID=A0A2K1J8L1_PHYPA|nr:hypothetical protein PHYPA_020970 [Physcomitrium patens]